MHQNRTEKKIIPPKDVTFSGFCHVGTRAVVASSSRRLSTFQPPPPSSASGFSFARIHRPHKKRKKDHFFYPLFSFAHCPSSFSLRFLLTRHRVFDGRGRRNFSLRSIPTRARARTGPKSPFAGRVGHPHSAQGEGKRKGEGESYRIRHLAVCSYVPQLIVLAV